MMLKLIGNVVIPSLSVLAMSSFLWLGQANAVDLSSGEVEAHFDTTLSYGLIYRVGKHEPQLSEELNGNDGDLNYDRGIVSNAAKFTSDLDVAYRNFGLFLRASGFYDHENENGTRDHDDLSAEALAKVGKDIDILDAYGTATFEFGDAAVDVRAGKHVLNWGESTFIQNGVNAINPFDVSKLRVPGADLREALVAVPLVSLLVELPSNLSVEGFYQLAWEKTDIDPVGTYFSTIDYVGAGARAVFIDDPRLYPAFKLTQTVLGHDPDFLNVGRAADRNPRDSGQWGMAFRYLAKELNNTEIGLYYMNYHSRLPTVSARTGTMQSAFAGLGATQKAAATLGPQLVPGLVQRFVPNLIAAGLNQQAALAEARRLAEAAVGGAASLDGIDVYADTGRYFIEYPEDIQLVGLSFNTQLGTLGWALQGEYTYRTDSPLQIQEAQVIEYGLAPFLRCLAQGAAAPACVAAGAPGTHGFETAVPGYIRRNVSQVQATATKVFGPTLGADGLAFITEVAMMYVHNMPDWNELKLESPADGTDPADSTSFGYRVAARLDYSNAVGAVNLYPYVQFQHDFKGNSPTPSGPFVEGRTALTLGLRADYLSRWQGNLGYTRYAGIRNELADRDFITATIKYFF